MEVTLGSYRSTVRKAILFTGRPFTFESGATLSPIEVAYETWGELNGDRSNAVLLVHALTGDSHAASHHPGDREGWFEGVVGEGRGLDPSKFHIVCANWLGSKYGTTGPTSINPGTGRPFGVGFPAITVGDISRVMRALCDHLEIPRWNAVMGGSVGGLITLDYAARYPSGLEAAVPVACSLASSPWVIAFHGIMRRILSIGRDSGSDELFRRSLEAARMVGMVTYRSRGEFVKRYQRARADLQWQDKGCSYAVESYLQYQGQKLDQRFDPTSYECLTRAADSFDLGEVHGGVALAASRIKARVLAIGIDSDYLFPLEEQQEIVSAITAAGGRAELAVIASEYGHDGFLIEHNQINRLLRGFLKGA
ncbi:MAG: homoserine O-acetyltransferase [Myxococcota bacterium]